MPGKCNKPGISRRRRPFIAAFARRIPIVPRPCTCSACWRSNPAAHEGAIQFIQQAIAIHPAPEYFGNLGIVASAMGRLGEGIDAYRKALAIKPDYPEALCNLGNALCFAGNSREAIELCQGRSFCGRRLLKLSII